MVNNSSTLDAVFAALADPTRRKIVERLARETLTVGELSRGFAISAPAISKHLRVLEHARLLTREVVGRTHHCRLAPAAMRSAVSWLNRQQQYWDDALDRLDTFITTTAPDSERE